MDLKSFIRPGKGAADITPLLANKEAFGDLVDRLAMVFNKSKIDKVVAIEGRGFILGSAVAYALKAGFVPLRYPGKLKNQTISKTFVDYSGKEKTLEIHQDAIKPKETVIIIDDWCQTGATLETAIALIEQSLGRIVGIGVLMDDSNKELKQRLKKYNYHYMEQVKAGDNF